MRSEQEYEDHLCPWTALFVCFMLGTLIVALALCARTPAGAEFRKMMEKFDTVTLEK